MLRIRFSLRSFVLLALACGAGYGLWQRWDAWTETMVLKGDGRELIRIELSKDEQRLLAAPKHESGMDPPRRTVTLEAWIWDVRTGARIRTMAWEDAPLPLVYFTDFLDGGNRVRLWDWPVSGLNRYGASQKVFDVVSGTDLLAHLSEDAAKLCLVSSDGKRAIMEFEAPRDPVLVDFDDPGRPVELKNAPVDYLDGRVWAFTNDGRYAVVHSGYRNKDPCYAAYDLQTGKMVVRREVRWEGPVFFAADGERLVVKVHDGLKSGVEAWDWKEGLCLGRLPETRHKDLFGVGDDRFLLAVKGEKRCGLYDARTLDKVADVDGVIEPISFNPISSRYFVSSELYWKGTPLPRPDRLGDAYVFHVWDSVTGKQLSKVSIDYGSMSERMEFEFSGDERWIVVTMDDGNSRMWRAESGEPMRDVQGRVLLLKDPDRYAVLGLDDRLSIHDLETSDLLVELMLGASRTEKVQGTRGGRTLYVAGLDGDVHCFWRRRPEQWWGIAWLPEFWVALVVAPVLLWSLWRDFKTLRKAS